MSTWQLQHAKAHFSEVIRNATTQGPQDITLHGEPVAVIISKKEFDKLTKPKSSLVDFLRHSPLKGLKLNLKRDKSSNREIEL